MADWHWMDFQDRDTRNTSGWRCHAPVKLTSDSAVWILRGETKGKREEGRGRREEGGGRREERREKVS